MKRPDRAVDVRAVRAHWHERRLDRLRSEIPDRDVREVVTKAARRCPDSTQDYRLFHLTLLKPHGDW